MRIIEIYQDLVNENKIKMSYREFAHKITATHNQLRAKAESLSHEKHIEKNQIQSGLCHYHQCEKRTQTHCFDLRESWH